MQLYIRAPSPDSRRSSYPILSKDTPHSVRQTSRTTNYISLSSLHKNMRRRRTIHRDFPGSLLNLPYEDAPEIRTTRNDACRWEILHKFRLEGGFFVAGDVDLDVDV